MRCRNGNFTKVLSRTDRLRDGDTSAGDISFVTPDITVDDYEKRYQLKASKHAGNDKITNSDAQLAAKASKLEWLVWVIQLYLLRVEGSTSSMLAMSRLLI